MVRLFLAALATTLLMAIPAIAQDAEVAEAATMIGPVVGERAPMLDSVEAIGTEAALERGVNGAVIVFVRSADWCPFCKTQLLELNPATTPLANAGWQLAALSYDSPAVLEAFATENALDFALLSDQGSEAIKGFNLLNEDMQPASRAYGIPHPAVVFVRNDGTIAAVLREEGYKTRPSVEAILEAAALLNEAAS
ncbi:MAG: redoxin domain-containing protein [Pseudomonadota bacterium]